MSASGEPGYPPTESLSAPTQEERTLALFCHLGGLFTAFIVPLVIWQMKKGQSRFVAEHAKEALNFQITLCLYAVACIVLSFILIGFLLIIIVAVFEIVVIIQACIAANKGEMYRYPLCWRIIKD